MCYLKWYFFFTEIMNLCIFCLFSFVFFFFFFGCRIYGLSNDYVVVWECTILCLDSEKIEEFTEPVSCIAPCADRFYYSTGEVRSSTWGNRKPNKSVSNLFIINHIVRFLTITNVERLKYLKSFFFFFLIFTVM